MFFDKKVKTASITYIFLLNIMHNITVKKGDGADVPA